MSNWLGCEEHFPVTFSFAFIAKTCWKLRFLDLLLLLLLLLLLKGAQWPRDLITLRTYHSYHGQKTSPKESQQLRTFSTLDSLISPWMVDDGKMEKSHEVLLMVQKSSTSWCGKKAHYFYKVLCIPTGVGVLRSTVLWEFMGPKPPAMRCFPPGNSRPVKGLVINHHCPLIIIEYGRLFLAGGNCFEGVGPLDSHDTRRTFYNLEPLAWYIPWEPEQSSVLRGCNCSCKL